MSTDQAPRTFVRWTPDEVALLRELYPHRRASEVAERIGRPLPSVYAMATKLGLQKSAEFRASPASGRLLPGGRGQNQPRNWRAWTDEDVAYLRAHFPVERTADVAKVLGRNASTTSQKARLLGLKKSPAYLESPQSGRIGPGNVRGLAGRFQRGLTPWNKGTHYESRGRSRTTQFRAGQVPMNARPIGSYRIRSDGYLEQKYSNDAGGPGARWRTVHRIVWEREHGPTPDGSIVVFRPGMFTTELHEITLDRLELVTRQELMRRNNIHKLPLELVEVIRLRGVVQRKINKRTRQA